MGARAEVHCYTPVELERRLADLPRVRAAMEAGTAVSVRDNAS
jgi:hypothetical protein